MPVDVQLTQATELSALRLVMNLSIGAILSLILSWHFVRFGKTLGNRTALGRMLPFVALTTVLIISVVKSSLALSLGLVGALSIVRFRTPIKEPEELAYIFMAIAIGLGLGADQQAATVIAAAFILIFLTLRAMPRRQQRTPNLYVNIGCNANGDGGSRFEQLTRTITTCVEVTDVRRLDLSSHQMQATYHVQCAGESQLLNLIQRLKQDLPDAEISFVDSDHL